MRKNLTHQDEHFKISLLNANAQVTHDRTKRPLKRYKFFSEKTHPNTLKSKQSIKKTILTIYDFLEHFALGNANPSLSTANNVPNSNIPYFSYFAVRIHFFFLIYYYLTPVIEFLLRFH